MCPDTEITGWIPCLWGDRQSLTVAGLMTFLITKGPSLLGQTGGHIVLCIQPNLSSNFIGGCRASLVIIVPCHLICSMLESSFCLIWHLGHLLGKAICSLYSGALGRL